MAFYNVFCHLDFGKQSEEVIAFEIKLIVKNDIKHCSQNKDKSTMIKLEKHPRLELSYEWEIDIDSEEPILYSKKFVYQKTDVIRVGMKMSAINLPSNPATLFLMTTNLHKMGLRVQAVSYVARDNQSFFRSWKTMKMEEKDLTMTRKKNNNEDENGAASGTQLFTAPLELFENEIKSSKFTFKFMVSLTGIVDNYRVHQVDGLLSQQLWSSITNQLNGPDLKLIANDGSCLPVHKWILAARSPVFAALFSSNEPVTSLHLVVDCTGNEISQFIKFIYTGELEGLVSHTLLQLAVKYQIKTLEDLCKTAFQDAYVLSLGKMGVIALHMGAGSHLQCNEEKDPDEELFKMEKDCYESTFTCSWNVQNFSGTRENQETIRTNVLFEHGGIELFLAEVEMKKNPEHALEHTLSAVKFLSFGHQSFGCDFQHLTLFIGQDKNSSTHQQIMITETGSDDEDLLKIFKCPDPDECDELAPLALSFPFFVSFDAILRSSVQNFINKPLDSTWSEQLWAASTIRRMTDVEFLVGEEAFGAHRSLVSARSPVFAAMFDSGMKEAETGQVRIEDVDPTTFQLFLKFLYTGMFEPSPKDRELFTVADKYGVDTLMELCRPATKTINMDCIFETFFSC